MNTNKVRTKLILSLVFIGLFLTTGHTQIGRLALSPVQKIEQKIARTDITIVYSRPSAKGRIIFGDLVKFGKHWRTGANRNTTIEFSEAVSIGGTAVPKGIIQL